MILTIPLCASIPDISDIDIRFKTVSIFGEAPTNMSSEMEAKMEILSVREGSSQEDWENLFRKCPEARAIILDSVDLESALACRLVCKEWRVTVNYYKNLWAKINEVCSIAANIYGPQYTTNGKFLTNCHLSHSLARPLSSK